MLKPFARAFTYSLNDNKAKSRFQSTLFSKINSASLTSEEQTLCDGTLTQEECFEALKNMESDKTPGTDGLPAEFYKVFWSDLSSYLIPPSNMGLILAAYQYHKDEGL